MLNAIQLHNVSKTYKTYQHGWQRLWEILTNHPTALSVHALQPLELYVPHGQVVGIVGNNGAGKSTLLKIVAGTLQPDRQGERIINGRVAALLELGSGFHPEMTGRENVYLSGTIMGLTIEEIDQRYQTIVEFAGIEAFIDFPVKTYSSGMFMRLAFAVATCVDPDVLIVDEALSVGDGTFARKSFDRIMQFRREGKTILFCSHSLYQVEKICDRVLWLDKGKICMDGLPDKVLQAYSTFLNAETITAQPEQAMSPPVAEEPLAQLTQIMAYSGSQQGQQIKLKTMESHLTVDIGFRYDPKIPMPTVGIAIWRQEGLLVSSASTHNDNFVLSSSTLGYAQVRLVFEQIILLRGEYTVHISLGCENAVHLYDQVVNALSLQVEQTGIEQGVVSLPHRWQGIEE